MVDRGVQRNTAALSVASQGEWGAQGGWHGFCGCSRFVASVRSSGGTGRTGMNSDAPRSRATVCSEEVFPARSDRLVPSQFVEFQT